MKQSLSLLIENSDPNRKLLINKLLDKNWFKKTGFEIQKQIVELPKDCEGMVRELSNRPDIVGNVNTRKLVEITFTKNMAILNFEVESSLTNEVFNYEYISFKTGNELSCRGLILIEENGQLKYFIAKKTNDFATATTLIGSISTYYPKFNSNKLVALPVKLENRLKKIVNSDEIKITRFIDLGGVFTDTSMTNNFCTLFTLVIEGKNIDPNVLLTDLDIQPIEKIGSYINKINDSYLLSIISRLISLDVIKIN